MSNELSPREFPAADFRATATAFSQLAGVLGGFCITMLVLVLSPDFLRDSPNVKDWVLGLLLLATVSYVISSSFLANSMNSLMLRTVAIQKKIFLGAVYLFSVAHLLLTITLAILVYPFSSTVSIVATAVIVIVVVLNLLANSRLEFDFLRSSR